MSKDPKELPVSFLECVMSFPQLIVKGSNLSSTIRIYFIHTRETQTLCLFFRKTLGK